VEVQQLFSSLQRIAEDPHGRLSLQECSTASELLDIDKGPILRLLYQVHHQGTAEGVIELEEFASAVVKAFEMNELRREPPMNMQKAIAVALKGQQEFEAKLADIKQALLIAPRTPVGRAIAEATSKMGLPPQDELLRVKAVNELHTLVEQLKFIKQKVGIPHEVLPAQAIPSANIKVGLVGGGSLPTQMAAIIELHKLRQPPWEAWVKVPGAR